MEIGKLAAILGYTFFTLGVPGVVAGLSEGNVYALGVFHVNTLHNIIHLATGAAFLWAAKRSECASLKTFQLFAFVYGLLAIMGNVFFDRHMIGPLAINQAGTLFHSFVAGIALYCGFFSQFRQTIQCRA